MSEEAVSLWDRLKRGWKRAGKKLKDLLPDPYSILQRWINLMKQ